MCVISPALSLYRVSTVISRWCRCCQLARLAPGPARPGGLCRILQSSRYSTPSISSQVHRSANYCRILKLRNSGSINRQFWFRDSIYCVQWVSKTFVWGTEPLPKTLCIYLDFFRILLWEVSENIVRKNFVWGTTQTQIVLVVGWLVCWLVWMVWYYVCQLFQCIVPLTALLTLDAFKRVSRRG